MRCRLNSSNVRTCHCVVYKGRIQQKPDNDRGGKAPAAGSGAECKTRSPHSKWGRLESHPHHFIFSLIKKIKSANEQKYVEWSPTLGEHFDPHYTHMPTGVFVWDCRAADSHRGWTLSHVLYRKRVYSRCLCVAARFEVESITSFPAKWGRGEESMRDSAGNVCSRVVQWTTSCPPTTVHDLVWINTLPAEVSLSKTL